MGVWGVAAVGNDDIRHSDDYTACGPPAVFLLRFFAAKKMKAAGRQKQKTNKKRPNFFFSILIKVKLVKILFKLKIW